MSPAAAASSCAAVRGRTPGSPSLALRPTMRACDARRLVTFSSPGVPTSHAGRSNCGVRAAVSPRGSVVPAPCRRSGTHCRPNATIAACNGYSCGSPRLIDSATAVRSDLPCTTVSLAGQCWARSDGAAEPWRLPCDSTPCSTPSLSCTNFSTGRGYGSPPSSL
eukprot:6183171-Pleurochrysis_carterae.AAC.1